MKVPDFNECRRLMDEHKMFSKVRRHSELVANISKTIADKLNENEHYFETGVVLAAGLLHDITKSYEIAFRERKFGTEMYEMNKEIYNHLANGYILLAERIGFDLDLPHEISADLLLSNLGYDELGKVVREHTNPEIAEVSYKGILAYADRIVLHGGIVEIDERFKYIEKNYPRIYNDEEFEKFLKNTKSLESLIQEAGRFDLGYLRQKLKID